MTDEEQIDGTTHAEKDSNNNIVHNPDVVNTDDASVANAPTSDNDTLRFQEGVEVGGIIAGGLDNSGGNDNWGQGAFTEVSESFDTAFAGTPEVGISPDEDRAAVGLSEWNAMIRNKSTTGFDVGFRQMAAVDRSAETDAYAVSYVASEGR